MLMLKVIFYINFSGNYKAPKPVLQKHCWYHGTLDRKEALDLLKEHGNKEGSYLVRYSDKNGGGYVLTMIVDKRSFHYQVKHEVRISEVVLIENIVFKLDETTRQFIICKSLKLLVFSLFKKL